MFSEMLWQITGVLGRRLEPTLASLDQHRTGPVLPHTTPQDRVTVSAEGNKGSEGSPLLLSFRDS